MREHERKRQHLYHFFAADGKILSFIEKPVDNAALLKTAARALENQ
jgi:hypothetical protein